MTSQRGQTFRAMVSSLVFGFLISWTVPLLATDCSPNDIQLSTQNEVDDFLADHGPCDHVVGQLNIGGEDITNVDGLSTLASIGSHLIVGPCAALANVDGFSNLTSIAGALIFIDNDALVNVNGLSNIASVGAELLFAGNDALIHLDGLAGIAAAGDIEINWNAALVNIDGLSGMSSVSGRVSIDSNPSLTNLTGLAGLTSIDGDLIVFNNPTLTDLGMLNLAHVGNDLRVEYNCSLSSLGLTSLTEVEASVYMYDNHSLTDLDQLAGLQSVGNLLIIEGHSNLSRCGGLNALLDPIDDGVAGPGPGGSVVPDVGGDVLLGGNLSGCNSIREVLTVFNNSFESPFNAITEVDKSLANTGLSNSIAVGGDDLPVIGYTQLDFFSGVEILRVAKCTDIRCTGSVINTLDGSDVLSIGQIATGQDGLPVMSYWRDDGLLVAKCNDHYCAGADESISIVHTPGGNSSLAIGTDGFPVISFQAEGALMVAKCNDPACSGGDETITIVNDLESSTGQGPSIAIGSDGFPVISYQRISAPFTPSTVKVAKCNDAACLGGDELISIIGNDGRWFNPSTSIAIGPDNFPVTSYPGWDGLTVVKCNDASCSSEPYTRVVMEPIIAHSRASLVLGTLGFPIITYQDYPDSALKVVHCEDAGCAFDRTISTIEHEHTYGPSSVTVGVDGLPVISYQDRNALSLKAAHCESEVCR